jgi:hypothetical protein
MLNRADAFLDDEAFFGDREVDAAADLFAGQAIVIAVGIEAKEREAKAIFAAG